MGLVWMETIHTPALVLMDTKELHAMVGSAYVLPPSGDCVHFLITKVTVMYQCSIFNVFNLSRN